MRDVIVRHDWTYRELLRLAAMAARRTSSQWGDHAEKADIAMLGIIELLWESTERPDQWSLVNRGSHEVFTYIKREASIRGINPDTHEPAPQHAMYWHLMQGEPATDRVIETLALTQVFTALSDHDAEVLWTRANFTTTRASAAALDMGYSAFNMHHRAARTNAYQLWYDDEPPPRVARDRRSTNPARLRNRLTNRQLRSRWRRENQNTQIPISQ